MEKLLPALELYDHGNSSYRTNHDHKGPEKFHHSYPYIRSLCEESVKELGDGTFHGESTLTFDSANIVITAARATPRLIAPYICLWRGHMISRSTYTGRKRMIFTIRGGRRKDIDRIRTRKYHRLCCKPGEMYSGTGHTIGARGRGVGTYSDNDSPSYGACPLRNIRKPNGSERYSGR